MLDKKLIYAVVGASNDEKKYGNKVISDLNSKHFRVIPVNPHEKTILEYKVYKNLTEIPLKVDFAIFVTQPKITEKILLEVKKLKIKKVWMQPGSESDIAIKFCEDNNINCIHNSCVMLE